MTLSQVVQQQVQEVVSVAGMKLTAVITGTNTYINLKRQGSKGIRHSPTIGCTSLRFLHNLLFLEITISG